MKLKAGDIFVIDLDEGFCLGQIFYRDKLCLYVGVFDRLFQGEPKEIDISVVEELEILFAHETLDALFHHKIWKIIANYKMNLDKICLPNYKVSYDGKVYVETINRQIVRPLNEDEILILRHRKVVAPIRIDNAVKAHFGQGDWQLYYEDLKYEYAQNSSKFD